MLFLIFVSHNIHYNIVGVVDNLKCPTLEHELKKIVRSYTLQGFHMILIIVNMQFKSLSNYNQVGVKFNIVSKEEYALIIE